MYRMGRSAHSREPSGSGAARSGQCHRLMASVPASLDRTIGRGDLNRRSTPAGPTGGAQRDLDERAMRWMSSMWSRSKAPSRVRLGALDLGGILEAPVERVVAAGEDRA